MVLIGRRSTRFLFSCRLGTASLLLSLFSCASVQAETPSLSTAIESLIQSPIESNIVKGNLQITVLRPYIHDRLYQHLILEGICPYLLQPNQQALQTLTSITVLNHARIQGYIFNQGFQGCRAMNEKPAHAIHYLMQHSHIY